MPTSPRAKLNSQLLKEIDKTILLEEEDKQYWRSNIETLPEIVIRDFFGFLQSRNRVVDRYILAALEKDPGSLIQIKQQIVKAKKLLLRQQEKEQTPENLEDILSKELEDIGVNKKQT